MIDLKNFLNDEKKLTQHLKNRGYKKIEDGEHAINAYKKYLMTLKKLEKLNSKKNEYSRKVGEKIRSGMTPEEAVEDVQKIGIEIENVKRMKNDFYEEYMSLALNFPNINLEDVPVGFSEEDNIIISENYEEYKREFDFVAKPHYEITKNIDSIRAVKLSGTRFTMYKSDIAQLERALVNFMLDSHLKSGFEEVVVPTIVKTEILEGTGHLPKFKEDLYKIENENKWLIPTAEVPLTNIYANEIIKIDELPIRMSALSNSYRSESDSGGKDIKGIIRLHEFRKVEMVSIANPSESEKELEFLVSQAENILRELEIPFRRLLLCTKEVSGAGAKTYDLEVFMPGLNKWKEISSISLCTDYQSRNAKIRMIEDGTTKLVHTLNGSGLAVDRCLAAVLENYQNEDGSFNIPNVLKKYYV